MTCHALRRLNHANLAILLVLVVTTGCLQTTEESKPSTMPVQSAGNTEQATLDVPDSESVGELEPESVKEPEPEPEGIICTFATAPPYAIDRERIKNVFFLHWYASEPDWTEVVAPDGTRYVAYTSAGLTCGRDVYLAVDSDNDGLYEEVLPTGLLDNDSFSLEAARLKLSIDDTGLVLEHNVSVLPTTDPGGSSYYQASSVRESRLDLAELRKDSDGDGLTDICEYLLFTDPDNSDTDGDGVSDKLDPTPNANADEMGPNERWAAKALEYYYRHRGKSWKWWTGGSGHPYLARYLILPDLGPVAFNVGDSVYGISLNTKEQVARYEANSSDLRRNSAVHLDWVECSEGSEEGPLRPFISNDLRELAREPGPVGENGLELPRRFFYLDISDDFAGDVVICEIVGDECVPKKLVELWIS